MRNILLRNIKFSNPINENSLKLVHEPRVYQLSMRSLYKYPLTTMGMSVVDITILQNHNQWLRGQECILASFNPSIKTSISKHFTAEE
jgi:hypothetical protein